MGTSDTPTPAPSFVRVTGASMGRATTKPGLLEAARTLYAVMWEVSDSLPDQDALFHFSPDFKGKEAHWARDKNLRDVLIHLHEWHRLLLDWVEANRKGEQKPFLPPPYNWTTYGRLNMEFWKKH